MASDRRFKFSLAYLCSQLPELSAQQFMARWDLSDADVARLLGVNVKTVQNWVKPGGSTPLTQCRHLGAIHQHFLNHERSAVLFAGIRAAFQSLTLIDGLAAIRGAVISPYSYAILAINKTRKEGTKAA